jgi:peroxiredoxin
MLSLRWCCTLLVPLALLLLALRSPADPPEAASIGRKIPNFTLNDTAGKPCALDDFKDKKAVVVLFLGTECPINNAYLPRLAELHKEYAAKGVQFLAINANEPDTADRVAEHAKKHAIPFPVLKDEGGVADLFAAARTPEAFLLDSQFTVRYRGRIDDQFGVGYQRPAPRCRDLAEAIDDLLAGKPVRVPATPVAGCVIARSPKPKGDATITYARDVAPILQKHCQECHRPGQIGPMPLLSYRSASSWSETIKEVVQEERMPPWHADPRFSKFSNDRRLSKQEKATLLGWIEQGCPKGDDKDLPPPRAFAEGWRIGKPDAVIPMDRTYTVPAKADRNGIRYQYFVVPTNFKEDVWVQAAEAKPGNRAVVHHIIAYVADPKNLKRDRADGIGDGFLVGYAPGDMPAVYEPGQAKKIPKGSYLVFQMHYTPAGTEQTDRSAVGLVFAKEPPKLQVKTRAIAQHRLNIPPGEANHKVESATTFPQETLLINMLPHMHLRGKSFEYRVVYPDGKRETLLSVPRYDFNWQTYYRLEKPLRLPAGTRIECTAYFDNSAANPNNPDPTKLVRWGEQTWDEMMIGFVDYVPLEK